MYPFHLLPTCLDSHDLDEIEFQFMHELPCVIQFGVINQGNFKFVC